MAIIKTIIGGLGAATGAYALGKYLGKAAKERKIEELPITGRQVTQLAKLNLPMGEPYNNGTALTPPMGWSSWNTFRNRISEKLVLEIAEAMEKSGLAAAGYQYLNIDDCWQSAQRDPNGRLQADLVTFPSGIPALVRQVNARGIKLGIYSSNGTYTCEELPASLGKEALDARTFAERGVEYLKYDFCHNEVIPMRAPCIEKIAVSALGSGEERYYSVEDAVLEDGAVIVEDEKLETGRYVSGLSFGGGAVVFPGVMAEEDGLYALTLCIRKKSHSRKFAVIEVNGEFAADTVVAPTWAMTKEGRHQLLVRLRAGENEIRIFNPIASRIDSAAYQYATMGRELKKATAEYAGAAGVPEKKITFSICEWGMRMPWKWGRPAGNLWRTTIDIKPFWLSILAIYEINVRLHGHAGPGGWNDPDMLEVGNGGLNFEENKAHFSLWCMMAAPLILGNDLRKFLKADGTPDTANTAYQIVTNADLIAIDQDPLGLQCRRIASTGLQDTLLKPLAGGDVAVCFFNKASETRHFTLRMNTAAAQEYVELPFASSYRVVDLWTKCEGVIEDEFNVNVPPHGVKVFRISAVGAPDEN
ncbi:MAG: alpha-galactosidase [Oscillospiraceae bacterium]|nr:alpha-galactosidase [Oscillospiraceae bacterium]